MSCSIYRPVCESGIYEWNNLELVRLYKEPSLSVHIQLKCLRWTGQVQRMPDTRVLKKNRTGHPCSKSLV